MLIPTIKSSVRALRKYIHVGGFRQRARSCRVKKVKYPPSSMSLDNRIHLVKYLFSAGTFFAEKTFLYLFSEVSI